MCVYVCIYVCMYVCITLYFFLIHSRMGRRRCLCVGLRFVQWQLQCSVRIVFLPDTAALGPWPGLQTISVTLLSYLHTYIHTHICIYKRAAIWSDFTGAEILKSILGPWIEEYQHYITLHTYIHIQSYRYTVHTYSHAFLPSNRYLYIHFYMHTCEHTYIIAPYLSQLHGFTCYHPLHAFI